MGTWGGLSEKPVRRAEGPRERAIIGSAYKKEKNQRMLKGREKDRPSGKNLGGQGTRPGKGKKSVGECRWQIVERVGSVSEAGGGG